MVRPMKKRTSPSAPFWYWSNRKGAGSSAENSRTVIELPHPPYPALSRMNYGHGRLDPAEVPVFEGNLEYTTRVEDCPWPLPKMFPVSDRLRGILEAAAPGNCQFFPMKLRHNGRPCPLVYWAMYVDAVDCADPDKSGWDHEGQYIQDPVIDAERVPASIHVFRVKDGPSVIVVRDSLRRYLKKEKVTGCAFYEPWLPSKAGR